MTLSVRCALTTLLAAGLASCTRTGTVTCDTDPWTALVRSHLARYPAMQPADAYKLLHQATLGSEHAMPSRTIEQIATCGLAVSGAAFMGCVVGHAVDCNRFGLAIAGARRLLVAGIAQHPLALG